MEKKVLLKFINHTIKMVETYFLGDKVEFYVDGDKIGSDGSKPYQKTYTIPAGKNGSSIDVRVKVTDDNGNTDSSDDDVSVNF